MEEKKTVEPIRQTTIRVPEDLMDALKSRAEAMGINAKDVVMFALYEWVKSKK